MKKFNNTIIDCHMCSSLYLIIMEKEDHNKVLCTSKEQIEYYLNFVRVHPEIKLHKNEQSRPKRVEELWAELSVQLNALKGPTRNPNKWRENLSHWKKHIHSRARRTKAHKLVTGGGPSSTIELSETEQRALDTLGSIAVDGLADVPTIATEEEVVFTAASSPLNTTSDESNDCTLSSSRSKKMTTDEMFRKYIDLMKRKAEEDRAFRIQTLDSINKHTESINNLAAAIVSLTQTIVKKT